MFSVNVSNVGPLLAPVRFTYPPFAYYVLKLIHEGRISPGKIPYLIMKFSTADGNFLQKTGREGDWPYGGREKEEQGRREGERERKYL